MDKDTALDLALEELENCADLLKVFEAPIDSCVGATMLQAEAAITAIKQARSAPVQEPVAWRWTNGKGWLTYGEIPHDRFESTPLYTTPPAAQRQWVGLTDEVIWSEYQTLWPFHPAEEPRLAKDIAKFARAIEAKLKEKNT